MKSMSILPLGIHSQKLEEGCSENGNNIWRIWLMTSSASCLRLMLFILGIQKQIVHSVSRKFAGDQSNFILVKLYYMTLTDVSTKLIILICFWVNTNLQFYQIHFARSIQCPHVFSA